MGLFDRTQYSYWKTNQSYDLFWILSIVGGIFALDHLYLRSPLTFLAKILVNIFALGLWWIYDATQSSFNKDVVKLYGLGIPGMGPMGIGAGSLASKEGEKPDPKHANFLIYSLALIFGGLFGLDSFVSGDKNTGFFRLICLISIIFTPIAILFWLFNLGKLFFKTETVIEQNWEYFGAPKPEHLKKSILERLAEKFPFLQGFIGLFTSFKTTVTDLAEHPLSGLTTLKDDAEAAITYPIKEAKKVISGVTSSIEREAEIPIEEGKTLISEALGPVESAVKTVLSPLEAAVQPIASSIQGAEQITDDAIKLGTEGLKTVRNVGDGVINAVKSVGQLAMLPGVAATTINSVTPNAIKNVVDKVQQQQQGGSQEVSYLAYVFVGTIALIAVSGLIKTYQRLRQNTKNNVTAATAATKHKRTDDTPPEPTAV